MPPTHPIFKQSNKCFILIITLCSSHWSLLFSTGQLSHLYSTQVSSSWQHPPSCPLPDFLHVFFFFF